MYEKLSKDLLVIKKSEQIKREREKRQDMEVWVYASKVWFRTEKNSNRTSTICEEKEIQPTKINFQSLTFLFDAVILWHFCLNFNLSLLALLNHLMNWAEFLRIYSLEHVVMHYLYSLCKTKPDCCTNWNQIYCSC